MQDQKLKKIEEDNSKLKFSVNKITEEGYMKTNLTDKLALLCQLSYKLDDNRKQSHEEKISDIRTLLKETEQHQNSLHGVELVDCNTDVALFKDGNLKHLYVIFRGTDPGDSMFHGDILNDAQIALWNQPTTRLNNAKSLFDSILTKYSDDWTTITSGHSLGGSLAENLTVDRERIDHCESFNPGTSYLSLWTAPIGFIKSWFTPTYKKEGKELQKQKIISHHFSKDPISMGPYLGYIIAKGQFPHSLSNFINLVDQDQHGKILNKILKLGVVDN